MTNEAYDFVKIGAKLSAPHPLCMMTSGWG